jgi:hypothetical protein
LGFGLKVAWRSQRQLVKRFFFSSTFFFDSKFLKEKMKTNNKNTVFWIGLRSTLLFGCFSLVCLIFCFVLNKTSFLSILCALLVGFLFVAYEKPVNQVHCLFQSLFQLLLLSFCGLLGIAKFFFATSLLVHVSIILYAYVFFLSICCTKYAKSLSRRTNIGLLLYKLKGSFFSYVQAFLLILSISVCGLGCCLIFLYNSPLSIVLVTFYSLCVHFVFSLPLVFRNLETKLQGHLKKRQNSLFFWSYPIARLQYFYWKHPYKKGNSFVNWLTALTFVRVFYPLFLGVVGLSIRIDCGLTACVMFGVFYATTFYVSQPIIRENIFSIYGKDCFRLAGWNHPVVFCVKCVGGGVGIACAAFVVREGFFICDDVSRNRRFDVDCAHVRKRNLLVDELRVQDPEGYAKGLHQYSTIPERSEPRSFLFGGNGTVNVQNNIGLNSKGVISTELAKKKISKKDFW